MTLKPQLSTFIAALVGGLFFIWMSAGILYNVESYSIGAAFGIAIPGIFGCVLSFLAVHTLLHRKHKLIIIEPDGITFTNFGQATHFSSHDIESIGEFAQFRGRGISIQLKNGEVVQFDCRHHCSTSKFLKLCKKQGLPCA